MRVKHLLFLVCFSLLTACASKKNAEKTIDDYSEQELYEQAQHNLDKGNYSTAISRLRAIESRFPFGRYAEQAQLELIYANYQFRDYGALEAAADRFIRLHPQHPNVDYAYYMKGLASFEQDRSFLARYLPLDMTQRDPGATRDSYNEFAKLVNRFPDSRYAPDAKQRMIYARNLLADYEVHVARYYIKRQAHLAALNRGRYIVENFQGTPAVADGLAIMVESYQTLGLQDLADKSLAVLELNHPEHSSLTTGKFIAQHKETASKSWLSKAGLGLLDKKENTEPPQSSQANREMELHLKDAQENIPKEIRAID